MMTRLFALLSIVVLVAACGAPQSTSSGGASGSVYKIRSGATSQIQFRMLDSVNSLRSAVGAPPVELEPRLTAAAATHSRDMSVQNRPWHFGSDGSSPIDRVVRVGYTGTMLGETISETFETELETLAAWMDSPGTRDIILDPRATDMGFAWFQERDGKIWWTLIMGQGAGAPFT